MIKDVVTDETLIIETPERVPLHFALASIGNRFLACALDHTIQVLAILILFLCLLWGGYLTGAASENSFADMPKWAIAAIIIVFFLIWSGYFALFETFWHGQTPGKRLLKLRVIREDGRPITFWEASARNIIRLFDMMPFPFYSVGLVSVFISARDGRIGDLVAGTVVVRERAAEAPSFAQLFNSPMTDAALRRAFAPVDFASDLNVLNDAQIEVVETFLRRRWDLKDQPRQWMAWRIATPIFHALRPTFDREQFTYEGFLEELLHRYRAAHKFSD